MIFEPETEHEAADELGLVRHWDGYRWEYVDPHSRRGRDLGLDEVDDV